MTKDHDDIISLVDRNLTTANQVKNRGNRWGNHWQGNNQKTHLRMEIQSWLHSRTGKPDKTLQEYTKVSLHHNVEKSILKDKNSPWTKAYYIICQIWWWEYYSSGTRSLGFLDEMFADRRGKRKRLSRFCTSQCKWIRTQSLLQKQLNSF